MKKYIGITIGPIVDTLVEASKPAALWFASSVFSDLTRRLCKAIKEVFPGADIFSPYYEDNIDLSDGIGKFHDRILFSIEEGEFQKEKLEGLILSEKKATAKSFPPKIAEKQETVSFLCQYLQVHSVVLDEMAIFGSNPEMSETKNCIKKLSDLLDSMELMKGFPSDNRCNPFRTLFAGEKEGANRPIKDSPLFKNIKKENNQLINNPGSKDEHIWTIEEIAALQSQASEKREDVKSNFYYAVVQADGDGVGSYLKKRKDAQVTDFSKACFDYAVAASKKIGDFGGMTIYAGGDDLLFLAPVLRKDGKNVFALCGEINRIFQDRLREDRLEEDETIPTVSFGISIQYIKSPLYEALESARLLLGEAKEDEPKDQKSGVKNKLVIDLKKHSGQSVKIKVSHDSLDDFCKFCEISGVSQAAASASAVPKDDDPKSIQSMLYHLQTFRNLFDIADEKASQGAISKEEYMEVWHNIFDAAGQQFAKGYIDKVSGLFYERFLNPKAEKAMIESVLPVEYLNQTNAAENTDLTALISMLRIRKFLKEKGVER